MKILMVSNYFSEHIGGEEIVAYNLVSQLRGLGHSVRWLAGKLPEPGPEIRHAHHPDDIEIPIWNITESRFGFPYPFISPLELGMLTRQVRWADVVHIHDSLFLTSLATGWLARRRGRPVLLTQHVAVVPYRERYKVRLQNFAYSVLARPLLEGAERVVCVSQVVQEWCARRFALRQPPLLIANGADQDIFYAVDDAERQCIRRELGIQPGQKVMLFVGRFTGKKGIRSIQAVAKRTPELSWMLIGRDGDENPRAWALPNVRVLAPLPQAELRKYYTAADLLVLPSVGEGFPLVVQEAMLCGTPALITHETARALPGLPALTTAPDGDALTDAVQALAGNGERLHAQRQEAACYARDHWDWAATAKQYEQVLAEMAAGGQA
jgi:glycosyltransferase involved in cell wall biosynthesis